MTVWVLSDVDWEDFEVLGVYSSREAAEVARERYAATHLGRTYWINEKELDKEP